MINSIKRTATLLFVVITGMAYSQQDLTLYYMDNIPQRQYLNPALRPNAKVTVGLPVISSIYINHTNTTFTPGNLFTTDASGTTLAIDKFKTKIRDNNYFGVSSKIDLFSLGIQVGKNFFSASVTENIFMRLNLSRGFLELPLYGNADFSHHGGLIDMSNTGFNFSHYREYGLGWQREFKEKLSIGVKVKMLEGKSNIWTKRNSYQLQTDPNTYDWNVSGELQMRSSGLDSAGDLLNGDAMAYMLNNKNLGAAIDLGISYELNERVGLNASLVDLGFIRWNSFNRNINSTNADFTFRGLDLTEVLYADSASSDSLDAAVQRLRAAAEDDFGYSEDSDSYTQMLIARVHLGATFKVITNEKFEGKLGVLVQSEFYNRSVRPSLTLSYSQNVLRILNASVSYSMVNNSFNNLGVGVSVNLGPVQIYGVMDNILVMNTTKFVNNPGEAGFQYPTNSSTMHARVGLNLTFGKKKASKKKDGIAPDILPDAVP